MLNLSFQLLKLFADGSLPATSVQSLANAAWTDGWGEGDEIARKLKHIGTDGKYAGNCQRDLLRLVKDLGIGDATPEPYLVSVKTAGGLQRTVGVFLPHEQLDISMRLHGIDSYRMSAEEWGSGVGLGGTLRSWGDSPGGQLDTRDVVAIGLHADGVSYGSTQRAGVNRSVLVAAWNAVSAESAADRGRRHLYFAMSKALCCDCGCEGHIQSSCVWVFFIQFPNTLKSKRSPTSLPKTLGVPESNSTVLLTHITGSKLQDSARG
jgi:hypothetical protein